LLPSFLIIGSQKAGTTSLYRHLIKHKHIISASTKETHFFSNNFFKGISWYRSQFNLSQIEKENKQEYMACEATPYYMFHPLAPMRIAEILPHIKTIILLRNPIDRAYSHFNHIVKLGYEKLSFEDAILAESKRLEGEIEKIRKGEQSFNHQYFSYISRGHYAEQIEQWWKLFPKSNTMIIKSEDFFSDPQSVLNKIFNFLDLTKKKIDKFDILNEGKYQPMKLSTRLRLTDYFKPHNKWLYKLLDQNFHWDNEK